MNVGHVSADRRGNSMENWFIREDNDRIERPQTLKTKDFDNHRLMMKPSNFQILPVR